MSEASEILAVRDTRRGDDGALWHALIDDCPTEAIDWAAAHFSDPGATFRVEFYLIDAPFAVVHRYQRRESDRFEWNPEAREPFRVAPVIQMLDELPPPHLMGR